MTEPAIIFEKSVPGKRAWILPPSSIPEQPVTELTVRNLTRKNGLNLPELTELDIVRHYTGLSTRNHGVDSGFYPLGSCTMKYNPKINEDIAKISGFTQIHPLSPSEIIQGSLLVIEQLEQPAAGAHG